MTRNHAVVIGAGIAGLFAARVLSETHDHVTVIDRDVLPSTGSARPGAPQGQHVHAVLMQANLAIQELFPGLIEDLVDEGVPIGDVLTQARAYIGSSRLAQTPSGMTSLCTSRPYLEYRIRDRLAKIPNIEVMDGVVATGLTLSPDRHTVDGVRTATTSRRAGEVIRADLVVDASGRRSRTPRWLEELGFPTPPELRVRVDVAYSSCEFTMPADVIDGDVGVLVIATPANPRGGGIIDMGNNQWLVSLTGYRGTHPPVSVDGFLDFARQLPATDVYEALLRATPVGAPTRFHVPHVTRRRYEKLKRFPEGLVVLGDAVTNFNPVYGQGMSVAAQEAIVLRQCLRQGGRGLRRLRWRIAKTSGPAWTMSVNTDLRMPWIEGRRTPIVRLGNTYLARLHQVAHYDPIVALALMRVLNLLDKPTRILRPSIVFRVLVGARPPLPPSKMNTDPQHAR